MTAWRARLAALPRGRDVRRFVGALRGPERASTIRSVGEGAWVSWTLRRHGVRPLVLGLRPDRPIVDVERGRHVAEAVDAGLGLLPLAPTCLRRSITLARELERLDLAGTVHVGVRQVDQQVEAHAWVQVGSVVVNDDPALIETYTRLATGELERLGPIIR